MQIFDFTKAESATQFFPINDRVMGGRSLSELAYLEGAGCSAFRGAVSAENGGGFASVRSEALNLNLSGFSALQLDLSGDGKIYKLRLLPLGASDGVAYEASFVAPKNRSLIAIPFNQLSPKFRGRLVSAGPFNPAQVGSIGFMISDKQLGAFELRLWGLLGTQP